MLKILLISKGHKLSKWLFSWDHS